jgi:hypothetical protein
MTLVAAGAFGFLIFSHAFDGPDLYGALSFFETMSSRPKLANGFEYFVQKEWPRFWRGRQSVYVHIS